MAIESNRYRMSAESLAKYKEELEYLQTVRTKEVAEMIREARSFGDLSENSEYDEAKTEQGKLYSKIAEIENLIENAIIVEASSEAGKAGIGARVTVLDMESNEEDTYVIVSSQEADPLENKISDDSPFGHAIVGHSEGDIIQVEAPDGVLQFKVVRIEK